MTATTSSSGALAVTVVSGGPVTGVAADATLLEVTDALAAAGIGALVVGGGDQPAGIDADER